MKMTPVRFSRAFRWAVPLAFAAALACSLMLGSKASANDEDRPTRKMERQIAAFERMVDEALVDSPNLLVPSRNEARGMYMDGYGLIVSFECSLVGSDMSFDHDRSWWSGWWGDDDDRVIVIDNDWDDEIDEEDLDEDDRKALKKWREKSLSRQEKRYTRGKAELVDALIDHAEILSSLKSDDWVELQGSLRGAPYFRKNDLHRLVLRAKMADLRAFSDGKLTEDAMIQKIQTKES
jgi:hypothetical protein